MTKLCKEYKINLMLQIYIVNHIKGLKEESYMTISINAKKALYKVLHSCIMKSLVHIDKESSSLTR